MATWTLHYSKSSDMLLNDLYTINHLTEQDGTLTATVQLNADHAVYQGHFPGNPVTPGVVQLQIVKDILQQHLGKDLSMLDMGRCKFLSVLDPRQHAAIQISITLKEVDDDYKASASGEADGQTFFKFNASYR